MLLPLYFLIFSLTVLVKYPKHRPEPFPSSTFWTRGQCNNLRKKRVIVNIVV